MLRSDASIYATGAATSGVRPRRRRGGRRVKLGPSAVGEKRSSRNRDWPQPVEVLAMEVSGRCRPASHPARKCVRNSRGPSCPRRVAEHAHRDLGWKREEAWIVRGQVSCVCRASRGPARTGGTGRRTKQLVHLMADCSTFTRTSIGNSGCGTVAGAAVTRWLRGPAPTQRSSAWSCGKLNRKPVPTPGPARRSRAHHSQIPNPTRARPRPDRGRS